MVNVTEWKAMLKGGSRAITHHDYRQMHGLQPATRAFPGRVRASITVGDKWQPTLTVARTSTSVGFAGGHTSTLAATPFVDRTLPLLVSKSKPSGGHRAMPTGRIGWNGASFLNPR